MTHVALGVNGLFLGKPHTGTGKYLTYTLQHLIPRYPHTHFYIYCPSQVAQSLSSEPFWNMSNVSIVRVDVPVYSRDDHVWKYLWERVVLPHALSSASLDVFWSPYHSTTQLSSIPHAMTVHDMVHHADVRYVFNRRRALYMTHADKAARQATHLFTVSHYSRDEISTYLNIPSNRITVTPLGAPTLAEPDSVSPLPYPFIMYVGGFDVRKNIPRLLEAFALFLKNNPETPYRLVMPGSIPDSPLISNVYEDIHRLQLTSRVVLPGSVSEQQLHTYLSHADTLVYPSLYEGFGLPILEGMQAYTPVITANFGSMHEVSGEAAHCIDTTSVHELAHALETVLHNPFYQRTLQGLGAHRVTQFTWEHTARIIGDTLHTLS